RCFSSFCFSATQLDDALDDSPSAAVNQKPEQHGPGMQPGGFPAGGFPAGGFPAGGFPAGGFPAGGFPAGGFPAGGFPAGGFPAGGFPAGGFPAGGFPPQAGGFPPQAGGFPPQAGGFPGPFPAPGGSAPIPAQNVLPFPGGLRPGMRLAVRGVVKPTPWRRFMIDLGCAPGRDVGMHISVRWDERPNVVVRNHMVNEGWGREERAHPAFPFRPGQPFDLLLCTDADMKVAVNGAHFFEFKHRVQPISRITAFTISGDVSLSQVYLT
uniref:Galectin n=1 Tax=Petromyzon marinus TaxID=7757 RepID=S4RBU8_PETMA